MIILIEENKKQYIELLLLADEQENMIDKYLKRGQMFALFSNDIKAICIVTDEGDGTCEIKNIATVPKYHKQGFGKQLIDYVCDYYKGHFRIIKVGTGESYCTIEFYQKCGFEKFYRVENFFIDNYDHEIIECGKQLVDMIYLKKVL